MAALQKIRSKGPLLVGVIGLALFAFIAGDAWKVLQPHQSQTVGRVAGKSLSAQDYQTMVEEFSEAVKTMQNITNLTESDNDQIKDQAWQGFLSETLIQREADKIGLVVTTDEIQYLLDEGTYQLLLNTPFVNTNGVFDKDMLNMFLVNYQNMNATNTSQDMLSSYQKIYDYWVFMQKNLEKNRLAEKYQYLLTKSIMSNSVEAENLYSARVNQKDILMAAVPYTSVQDSTYKVYLQDVESYLKKHREQYYQDQETRDLRYIDVQVTASEADRAAIEREVLESTEQLRQNQADYATFIRQSGSEVAYLDLFRQASAYPSDVQARLDSAATGEVFGPYYNGVDNTLTSFRKVAHRLLPDSVQFRQIQVTADSQARLKELSDSIYNAVKGGADFAEVAKIYGQTGEPTWISSQNYEGATSLDADNTSYITAVTTSPRNQLISLPLAQATIILEVTDQRHNVDKYKIAVLKRTIDFSKETYNKAYNDFSEFVAANPTLDKMIANAEDNGYRLLTSAGVYASNHNVGSIQGTREALKWAFEAKKGEASSLYECGESDRLLMVGVEKINKKGYRKAEDLQNELYTTLLNEKKAKGLLDEISAKGASFETVAAMQGAQVDTLKRVTFAASAYSSKLMSSEPNVSAWSAVGQDGQVSAPIQGNSGVYVLRILSSAKTEAEYDERTEMTGRASSLANIVASQFMSDLYLKGDVTDKRYILF